MSFDRLLSLSLSTFWAQPAFAAGGADFSWIDVAIGAMVAGDWPAFERGLSEGLAAADRARADGVDASREAAEAAATEFRYDRDLISGDDLAAWLGQHHLTTADWLGYFTRSRLREHYGRELDDTIDRFPPSARQLHEAALADGVCSGHFEGFLISFSRRVALALAADDTVLDPVPADDLAHDARRLARQHGHWLGGHDADDVHDRFLVALRVQRAFAAIAETLTTPAALQLLLETRQMDWTRLTIESLSFSTTHAAREAILCVRIDGRSLNEVARLSRQTVRRTRVLLEDVPAPQRMALLGAATGQVFGPIVAGDVYEVAVVVDQALPTLDDVHVEARARSAAIAEAAARASRRHVARARG
jgi:hypothetical protein